MLLCLTCSRAMDANPSGTARPSPKPNFQSPLRRRHAPSWRLSHSTPPCRAEPRRAVHCQCDALQSHTVQCSAVLCNRGQCRAGPCQCDSVQSRAKQCSAKCTALHCTALHCTALHCTVLHSSALCSALFVCVCKYQCLYVHVCMHASFVAPAAADADAARGCYRDLAPRVKCRNRLREGRFCRPGVSPVCVCACVSASASACE